MAPLGYTTAALLGAAAMNLFVPMLPVPMASAAWGWQLNVTAGGPYTCEEGALIGCGTRANCDAKNFTCTLVPKAGTTCSEHHISVQCRLPAGDAPFIPSSTAPKCVNFGVPSNNATGVPGVPSNNATLSWSNSNPCGSGLGTHGVSHVSGAAKPTAVAAGVALVLMWARMAA